MIGRAVGQGSDQDRRRWLVLAAYASLAAYVVASVLIGHTAWFWPIQFGWVIAVIIYVRFLRRATDEIADESLPNAIVAWTESGAETEGDAL